MSSLNSNRTPVMNNDDNSHISKLCDQVLKAHKNTIKKKELEAALEDNITYFETQETYKMRKFWANFEEITPTFARGIKRVYDIITSYYK